MSIIWQLFRDWQSPLLMSWYRACLYADYNDQTNQTMAHILGSLLRQFLTTAHEPIQNEVIQKRHDIQRQGGKRGFLDLWSENRFVQKMEPQVTSACSLNIHSPHHQRGILGTQRTRRTPRKERANVAFITLLIGWPPVNERILFWLVTPCQPQRGLKYHAILLLLILHL